MKFLLSLTLLCTVVQAQNVVVRPAYSSERIEVLTHAIAVAEGFYVKKSIPNRYHNPGDLKGKCWTGHTGKGGHAIFSTDAAGQAALRYQLEKIIAGDSRYYTLNTTVTQMARCYAHNWRPWAKRVSASMGVTPDTKLNWLCGGDVDVPPVLQFNQEAAQ